jgi:hypothetical protein
MPGADASQFIQMKKASAVQRVRSRSDLKSTNHLTQFVTRLSGVSDETKFLPSLTLKDTKPVSRIPINRDFAGKKHSSLQNCA